MLARVLLTSLLCVCDAGAQQATPEQLFQEAQQAHQAGDYGVAVRKYQELIRLHPEMVAARANLGVALGSLGRYDEAIEQYNLALQRVPGNRDLRMNLALAYYKGGRLLQASEGFSSLLKEEPVNVRIATLLSDCYLRLGRDAQVIPLLLPFEKSDPRDLAVEWALGSAMIHTGRTREGLQRVERVAQEKQLAEAYAIAGEAHLRLEEFEQAQRSIETALRLNSNLPRLQTLTGMIKEYASDLDGAETAYRKAIGTDPNDFEPHLRLGAVLYRLRRLDEAKEELERALQMDPASSHARFELAKVEIAQGKIEAAVGDLEKVEQAIPEWLPPHVELAALYYRLKRPEDGLKEKHLVDRITEEERQRRSKSKIISPELPSQ
jgi:tetratricopeptide (TPR) repeat protein